MFSIYSDGCECRVSWVKDSLGWHTVIENVEGIWASWLHETKLIQSHIEIYMALELAGFIYSPLIGLRNYGRAVQFFNTGFIQKRFHVCRTQCSRVYEIGLWPLLHLLLFCRLNYRPSVTMELSAMPMSPSKPLSLQKRRALVIKLCSDLKIFVMSSMVPTARCLDVCSVEALQNSRRTPHLQNSLPFYF